MLTSQQVKGAFRCLLLSLSAGFASMPCTLFVIQMYRAGLLTKFIWHQLEPAAEKKTSSEEVQTSSKRSD